MLCNTDTVIAKHKQHCFEFTCTQSGKGIIYTGDVATPVMANDIYISFKDEIHEIISDKNDPLQYFFIGFDTLNPYLKSILIELQASNFKENSRCINDLTFKTLFVDIISELIDKLNGYETIIAITIQKMIINFYRKIKNLNLRIYYPKLFNNHILVNNVMNFIDEHAIDIKDLNIISEKFNYNYSYISRIFSSLLGETLQNHLTRKKLEKAKEMIEKSDLSITDIAEKLQYSSIHVFSRAFRHLYRMSPLEYKNIIKNNKSTK